MIVAARKDTREPVAVFKSAAQAARATGASVRTIQYQVRTKTLSANMIYFRNLEDFDKDEDWCGLHNRPVMIEDVGTFANMTAAAKAIGCSVSSMRRALGCGSAIKGHKVGWS